jgi:hypothetical protein
MRKYLLSTSTLAGAALLSSAAMADVSVTGNFEWDYASRDHNVSANDGNLMGHDQEVHFTFTNKTDSGLTITAYNQYSSHDGTNDDTYVSIAGGFGTLKLGQTDGVTGNYEMNPLGLLAEEEGGTLHSSAANTTATIDTSTSGGGGNANKISYHIPAMGGLTAGISQTTSTTLTGDDDISQIGAKYALEASGAAITLGYSSSTTEVASAVDNDRTSMGIKVVMNGVSIMAAQGTYEGADEDRSTTSAAVSYTLANGLTVGYGTAKSEDDLDAGEEYTGNHYEASYVIATGLTAVLNVSDFDYKEGTDNGADTSGVDMNGTTTSLTLKASF